jgi:hypothetical protein
MVKTGGCRSRMELGEAHYEKKFARDLQEQSGILALLALLATFRICKLQISLAGRETDPVSGHHILSDLQDFPENAQPTLNPQLRFPPGRQGPRFGLQRPRDRQQSSRVRDASMALPPSRRCPTLSCCVSGASVPASPSRSHRCRSTMWRWTGERYASQLGQ